MAKEWYDAEITLTTEYQAAEFGFESDAIIMVHDGSGDIRFSWSGLTTDIGAKFKATDAFIVMDNINKSRIYLKSTNAGDKVRLFVWRRSK